MFGPRITTVFQNRWKALAWSLSILGTAYCAVPPAEKQHAPLAVPSPAHHSPWDKDR